MKKTAADERVVQSFIDKNPHFCTEVGLKFDFFSSKMFLDLNNVTVCQFACHL